MAKRDWMNVDGTVLALSLLAAGESAHAASSFLPSYFTIKTLALDGDNGCVDQKLENLRSGYKPALIFGLGLGAVVSVLAKSLLPFVFSAATGVVMMNLYEGAVPKEKRLAMPFGFLGIGGQVTAQSGQFVGEGMITDMATSSLGEVGLLGI